MEKFNLEDYMKEHDVDETVEEMLKNTKNIPKDDPFYKNGLEAYYKILVSFLKEYPDRKTLKELKKEIKEMDEEDIELYPEALFGTEKDLWRIDGIYNLYKNAKMPDDRTRDKMLVNLRTLLEL